MGGKARTAVGLSPEWRRWVCKALAENTAPAAVVAELEAEGVPSTVAHREVQIIGDAADELGRRARRYELVLKVLAKHAPGYIERRELPAADEFFDRYFSASRPVVLTDGCVSMAAARWTFEDLASRFGEVKVDVGLPDPERVLFSEALARMLEPSASPDFYIQSHNRVLAGPLAGLRDELQPLPEFLDPTEAPVTANMWLGPKGTISPLHHDTTHVYFCQLFGRKLYELVAPWEVDVLDAPLFGTDSEFEPLTSPSVKSHRIELSPGESLFIPIGWWHRVTALEPSISVSMRSFVWDAGSNWYRPGY